MASSQNKRPAVTTNFNLSLLREPHIEQQYSSRNIHDHLKDLSVEQLQQITADNTYPFWVCTLNVLGDLNTATVIRSAHLMGAEKVVIFGRRRIDNRGLVGAQAYTTIERVLAVDSDLTLQSEVFEDFCNKNNVVPLMLEHGGQCCYQFDFANTITEWINQNKKPMLVVGTEREGIPDLLVQSGIRMGGKVITIPQRGVIRSHNLSMAFAIVASQIVSQMNWF